MTRTLSLPVKVEFNLKSGGKVNFRGVSTVDRAEMQLYWLLEKIDEQAHGKLRRLLNATGHAHLTVCPICLVDDFVHVEDCGACR